MAPRFALLYFVMLVCPVFSIPPSSSPIDLETDVDATKYDYILDGPSLPEEPGKQTPLEHSDIAHFFPFDACIRTATAFCMILL